MESKRLAAEKAVEYVDEGMIVGLGTGSTAYWAIRKIGERVQRGLNIKAVASSMASEQLAKEWDIPLIPFADIQYIDITIDGADEADEKHNLIKGGGGALLREKILAYNSKKFIVVIDESKLVPQLGRFPLPVEIVPFAADFTLNHINKLGGVPELRRTGEQNYVTDNGNFIADCRFNKIANPEFLNRQLHDIPGVVETGLFLHQMVALVIVGYANGEVQVTNKGKGES
jgi:ribose 5-phosphate isomerase A